TNNTVIEFHRWLGDLMDDALATGNDLLDITDATASERSTDNIITLKAPFNIDDTLAKHLFDGSIIQDNGNTIYEGILVFAAAGMYLGIVQNGAVIAEPNNFWTTGLNADAANGISHRFMLKVRTAGADIDGRRIIGQTREFGFTYSEFKINGTSRGNNVLALTYASDLNNQTAAATVAGWTTITNTTVGYRLLDVNNDTTTEPYYSEWNRDTFTINQFYERMKWVTRRGSAEIIYPAVTGLNGELFRGITHEVNVDTPTLTFSATGAATWAGGTGQMLAINSTTAPTKMWIQLKTGVAPTDNQTITVGTATCLMNITITERTLSFPFIGASTGSAIIGAYGVGIEVLDLTSSDKLTDLTNTLRVPPNNVTFTVSGLVIGEDRVLVAPLGREFAWDTEGGTPPFVRGENLSFTLPTGTAYLSAIRDDGTTGRMQIRMLTGSVPTDNSTITGGTSAATAIVNGTVVASEDPRQLKLLTTLSLATETAVVCTAAIPTDTPSTSTGTGILIRIQLNTGIFRNVAYTSYTGSTFTIASTDFSGANTATGGATEVLANSI
ncbi:MAG: hypothetical protein Q8M83_05890, partial [bacterium]|nr:hypothetical protein [bacterium]